MHNTKMPNENDNAHQFHQFHCNILLRYCVHSFSIGIIYTVHSKYAQNVSAKLANVSNKTNACIFIHIFSLGHDATICNYLNVSLIFCYFFLYFSVWIFWSVLIKKQSPAMHTHRSSVRWEFVCTANFELSANNSIAYRRSYCFDFLCVSQTIPNCETDLLISNRNFHFDQLKINQFMH